jgi:hypothetical protein
VVGGIGQAELVEAAGGSPLSGAGLRERKGLRLPLPERVALQSEGVSASEVLEASFQKLGEGGVSLRALGAAAGGLVELQEVESSCGDEQAVGQGPGPTWQVSRSSLPSLPEGTLVTLYDTTPRSDAPTGAQGAEGMKSLRLQSSDADPGAVAYNGVGGVSLEGYPREYDGVNVSFTIWTCGGATGSCSVLEDAEDPGALVCEFGPPVIREGLTSMLPGETRRFWISADVADRRFGRPLPERILPMGSLVVDMTLRSIDREAVFSYVMTPESRNFCRGRTSTTSKWSRQTAYWPPSPEAHSSAPPSCFGGLAAGHPRTMCPNRQTGLGFEHNSCKHFSRLRQRAAFAPITLASIF